MASNFAFLTERWPVLASLGRLAEEYLHNDPNKSMFKIRHFGEALAQMILAIEKVAESNERSQNSRFQIFRRDDLVPSEMISFFHPIKNLGNSTASCQPATVLIRRDML